MACNNTYCCIPELVLSCLYCKMNYNLMQLLVTGSCNQTDTPNACLKYTECGSLPVFGFNFPHRLSTLRKQEIVILFRAQ